VGSLPFRGGLYPFRPERFYKEYCGARTAIIQSAFRYDFPKAKVLSAIKYLNSHLPKGEAKTITADEEKIIIDVIKPFESSYKKTVEKIAPLINDLAKFLPKRRERVQHIGLFGYSRGIGKVSLRAPSALQRFYILWEFRRN